MASVTLTLEEVNKLSSDSFIKIFGNVVEHYPSAAIGILKNRPFETVLDISYAINYLLDGLSSVEKEKILLLHPDLSGKLEDMGNLSNESQVEQKSVGLDCLSIESRIQLGAFNDEYTEKFGFPFVVCVRENKLSNILRIIQERLKNDKQQELQTGIEEVKKISKIRIFDIVMQQ